MTSRRSIQGYAQRQSRALQFVPGHVGGRVASAQPVLRRQRIGAAGAATPPTPDVWAYFTGGGEINYGQINYPSNQADMGAVDGETYVALLTCVGVAPLLPAGWTTILSGSVGSIGGGLYYRAGYIQWTGATPSEQICTITGGVGSLDDPTNTGRMVWDMWGVVGHYTPHCSVTTRAAATSHPFETPSSAWGSPWNMNAYLVPHPLGSSSASPTFDAGFTPTLVNYGEGAGYPFLCADMDKDQFGGSAPVTAHATTRTSVNAWDSASFAFGFTA